MPKLTFHEALSRFDTESRIFQGSQKLPFEDYKVSRLRQYQNNDGQ